MRPMRRVQKRLVRRGILWWVAAAAAAAAFCGRYCDGSAVRGRLDAALGGGCGSPAASEDEPRMAALGPGGEGGGGKEGEGAAELFRALKTVMLWRSMCQTCRAGVWLTARPR